MYFARVIGTVWATRKDENLKGFKLQFLQPINAMRENAGEPIVAVDTVGAGPGETVMYITAREAVIPLPVPLWQALCAENTRPWERQGAIGVKSPTVAALADVIYKPDAVPSEPRT